MKTYRDFAPSLAREPSRLASEASWLVWLLLCVLVLLLSPTPARAATLDANPATLASVWKTAKAGDTIIAAPGVYGDMRPPGGSRNPPLTVDLTKATISGAWYGKLNDGLVLKGGTFTNANPLRFDSGANITISGPLMLGPGTQGLAASGYGIRFVGGSNIRVDQDAMFVGFRAGMTLDQVAGAVVTDASFSRMSSDGIVIGQSRDVRVTRSLFYGTDPAILAHPDAAQLIKGAVYSENILFDFNIVRGPTQGFFGGNAINVVVDQNDVEAGFPRAISYANVRGALVSNNRVRTARGSPYQARIVFDASVLSARQCGNVVEPFGGKPGVIDPPCAP